MLASGKWHDRAIAAAIICLVQYTHQRCLAGVDNTPAAMLLYHGSAALADFLVIAVAAHCLKGQISQDIQSLNLIAMAVNCFGWIAYLAYAQPTAYNTAIGVLGYVQMVRLIWPGRHDPDYLRLNLVLRDYFGGHQLHFGAKAT